MSASPNQSGGPESAATKFRHMLSDTKELIVYPGVYNGFSAHIALRVGFEALYMTGVGTTASRLGYADLRIATLNDMREHAEMIANLDPLIPLIADMDTGYGGPINVHCSVSQYIHSGVAGFHIEDQVQTKRCGHLAGKELVQVSTFLSRIRAASAAREANSSDIVIIARTDALQSFGYDESIAQGITSKDMCARVVKDLAPLPLLLNMVEHGATPTISVDDAKELGFRIIIFLFAALAPAYAAIKESFKRLKEDGLTGLREEFTPEMLFQVSGMSESMKIDQAAGGEAYEMSS